MAQTSDSTNGTNDPGWDVGVRVTVPAEPQKVWAFLTGAGLPLWLGRATLPTEKHAVYETDDGVRGRLIARTEGTRVIITWRPDDWPHDTTLQLTVRADSNGTIIAIRHEKLADRDERRMMLGHWKSVLAELEKAVNAL